MTHPRCAFGASPSRGRRLADRRSRIRGGRLASCRGMRIGDAAMSSSDDDFGFAPPPFKPEDALVGLKRQLRDLQLAERGHAFEQRGKRIVELAIDGAAIQARLARRLAQTPEWDRFTLKSAADQRKFIDEVKKRLARWEHDE